ncbi:MAG: hypothetical protein WCL44_11945 [bacterium]
MRHGIWMLVSATLLASCSEPDPAAPTDRNAHPAAWMNPAATGNHGADVVSDGNESCTSCHGPDLRGTKTLPGCTECHFDPIGSRIPPGTTWSHGATPHNELSGNSMICNNCHGIYRKFGLPPATCHDCHGAGASHPIGSAWLDKKSGTFHGIDAERDPAQCAVCHGDDYRGGSSGVSCYACHFGPSGSLVPAGVSWSHGTTPHSSLSAHEAVCNGCHASSRSYGNGPASCHDCHRGSVIHATGQSWLDRKLATFHGIPAAQNLAQCAACHGNDYQGGTSGVSCYRCHFGPSGSKAPAGGGWTHGTAPHSSLGAHEAVCSECHDLDRSYGNGPASCHDCHESSVTHQTGSSWLLPGNHAQQSIGNRSSCLGCHDLKNGGGKATPSCQSCHTVSDPPMSIGACSSCHSSSPGTGRHSKHRSVSCGACHDGFGTGSLQHYYPSPSRPADVKFKYSSAGDNITYNGSSCSGVCHMGSEDEEHEGLGW